MRRWEVVGLREIGNVGTRRMEKRRVMYLSPHHHVYS